MPGFDIPEQMQLFYWTLQENGWINPSSEPDEWTSGDDQFEINIAHTASSTTIRYRKRVHRLDQESTDAYYERRSSIAWNSLSRAHGGTSSDFRSWLGRAYMTIAIWCDSNRAVATAPGE